MTVSRVTRVSNPRKMTLKQKLHFGSARQRAAAKASLKSKRNPKKRASAHRTRTKIVYRTSPAKKSNARRRPRKSNARRRIARRNPPYILTLGTINPRPSGRKSKRRTTNAMPATTKRRRRRTTKASNPKRRRNPINPRRRRRSMNPRRRRMNARRHTRPNPSMFGRQMGAFEVGKLIVGGLAGVAVTKAVPNMLPSFATSSPLVSTITSIVVAVGGGMLIKSLVKSDPTLGDSFIFGGLMQAGSVALNAFLPSVGTVIGLQGLGNGMGDLVPGGFPVPMNPIMAGQRSLPAVHPAVAAAMSKGASGGSMPAAPAAPAASGVGAIFNPWGRAV